MVRHGMLGECIDSIQIRSIEKTSSFEGRTSGGHGENDQLLDKRDQF